MIYYQRDLHFDVIRLIVQVVLFHLQWTVENYLWISNFSCFLRPLQKYKFYARYTVNDELDLVGNVLDIFYTENSISSNTTVCIINLKRFNVFVFLPTPNTKNKINQ